MTLAYMRSLEDLIRRQPEQWIWVHDRWKKSLPLPEPRPEPVQSA
jgi:lauroyl/myristoyl acyltransferase